MEWFMHLDIEKLFESVTCTPELVLLQHFISLQKETIKAPDNKNLLAFGMM